MKTASRLSLAEITVIALEQAAAAPFCAFRLADAGARVIKIERAESDFARGYGAFRDSVSCEEKLDEQIS